VTFTPIPTSILSSRLVRNISADDLVVIVSRASSWASRADRFIFHQGELARAIFLLESGRVRLHENTTNGNELLVRFVVPGDVFGDKGALPEETYGASAKTDAESRVYCWTQADIAELSKRVPQLQTNLFALVTGLLTNSRERYRLLATEPVEIRLSWALKQLALIGNRKGRTIEITGQSVQKDIADLASTTIFSVNRILNNYVRKGLLTISRGRIVLTDEYAAIMMG
jgi:CRP/FNR family transcriptional regulator, nitrogen oxide reductase regulator